MTWLRHALWPLGLALTAVLVVVIRDNPATTLGGVVPGGRVVETAAALGLLVAASIDAWPVRGVLIGVLGLVWLVPELCGWLAGPPAVRVAADGSRAVIMTVAAFSALLALDRRPRRSSGVGARPPRRAAIVVGIAGGAALVARVLLTDPFLDARCWQNCQPNPLVLPGFDNLGELVVLGSAAVVGAVMLIAVLRGAPIRPAVIPALALAMIVIVLDGRPGVRPAPAGWSGTALFLLAQAAALAVTVGVLAERNGDRRVRSRMTQLADRLLAAPVPGGLTPALRAATGDPTLRADYWVPERGHYVDAEGRSVESTVPGEARATPLTRRGEILGRLVHGRSVDSARIESAFGAALRLSLENERLRAATLAELHELRSSRMRLVDHAADERRRLERNLHDGAQQRVVALTLLTRMMTSRATDPEVAGLAQRADKLTRAVLEELRRIARGLYPVVLTDSGLLGAVLDLAQSSRDVAVELGEFPMARYPGRIEATAYVVISGALADARCRAASQLVVSSKECNGILTVTTTDDSELLGTGAPTTIEDQVAAVAGSLRVENGATGTRWLLEVPCAS